MRQRNTYPVWLEKYRRLGKKDGQELFYIVIVKVFAYRVERQRKIGPGSEWIPDRFQIIPERFFVMEGIDGPVDAKVEKQVVQIGFPPSRIQQ